jgi:hypothetical protein
MYGKPDMMSAQDRLAHLLSEIHNDSAPIGWERYRSLASSLMSKFPIHDIVMSEKFFDPTVAPTPAVSKLVDPSFAT